MDPPNFLQQQLSRVNIAMDRLDRMFGDQGYADRRRQVIHHIHLGTHFPNQISISKIGMHDIQVGVAEQMIQIAFLPCAQVVHDGDGMLLLQKQFRQMRSYESVSTGDENAHLLAL